MKQFKFFRGITEDINLSDTTQSFPTASLYNPNTWTPLEQVREIQERIQRAEQIRNELTRPKPNWFKRITKKISLYSDQIFGIAMVVFAIFWVALVIITKLLNIW